MSNQQHLETVVENEAWSSLHAMQFSIKYCFDRCLQIFSFDIDTDVSILCLSKMNTNNIAVESDLYIYDNFKSVHELANSLPEVEEKTKLLSNNPRDHEKLKKSAKNKIYKSAIDQICNTFHFNEAKKTYVIGPLESEKFQIYPIISVDKSIFNKFYQLSTDKYNTHEFDKSFMHSCISIMISKIASIIINDDGDYPFSWSVEEIHNKAAQKFATRLGIFATHMNSRIYDILNTISAMKYEKKENYSYILFSMRDNSYINYNVLFETPSDFYEL